MPKSQFVDPSKVRKSGKISFTDIELNAYSKTEEEEKLIYTKNDFLKIYRDMKYIRDFESMLYEVKTFGEFKGIKYNCLGPTHLAIGQEAAAVGQSFLLDENDFIFGTHRNHGEVLAKGLSVIEKMSDNDLYEIMRSFKDGKILSIIEKDQETVKELAIDFLLYGMLAEIFAKESGFNSGLGGSMHAFFTPFGIYPNNAIVGATASIAAGAALNKKVNNKSGICISNLGDGALGRGPVWEAMNFSAMDQFTKLWDNAYKGGLPIIFNFNNNFYGMGGQTSGETMAFKILARIGAGISPSQLHAERIDGNDPLAVIDAMSRKLEIIKNNQGPVLLDTITYRLKGHSNSDKYTTYRSEDELNEWLKNDPIKLFRDKIINYDITSESEISTIDIETDNRITKIFRLAADEAISPRINLKSDNKAIEKLIYTNIKEPKTDKEPEVLIPINDNPRILKIKELPRYGKDGLKFKDALFEAIIDGFYKYSDLIGYGEEVRDWGGTYGVYEGLTEALPYHRLFNAPISESLITGSSVGFAMAGGRAIIEIMYSDFIGCAADELFNQLAKWHAMSAGEFKMPVVVRIPVGYKYGAQHSQELSALCAHIPGLKCVFPATPYDAKGLMNSALSGNDPVIFFESQRIYEYGEFFQKDGVPKEYYEIPIGEPDIKREGSDITILSIGATLYEAIKAADELEKYGVSAEVIDARSIVPFNYEKVIESIRKTHKIVLCSDAVDRGSVIKNIAANITETTFELLEKPPITVGSRNWLAPPIELEEYYFPHSEWILDAIHERLIKLNNYKSTRDFTPEERLRREKFGV